jgi:hypothetical protein
MQPMQRKHLFSSRGIGMPRLFVSLELSTRKLHVQLQGGLLGA